MPLSADRISDCLECGAEGSRIAGKEPEFFCDKYCTQILCLSPPIGIIEGVLFVMEYAVETT